MRDVTCAACDAKVPMSEAFSLSESTMCRPCLEKFLEQPEAKIKKGDIARLADPTVCTRCSADQGEAEWPTVAGLPHCTTCEEFMRNRPFPGWLKIAFVVFLGVTIAAFVYNLRFFLGYVEILKANRAMDDRDIVKAAEWFEAASKHLPEYPELEVLPNMAKAQQLLKEDKNEEALQLVRKTREYAPAEAQSTFRGLELAAQAGLAFEGKDYDKLVEFCKQAVQLAPDEPAAVAAVASAYACKYASTGDEAFRTKALAELGKAKAMKPQEGDELEEYENRIQHRLATREVIRKEEFAKRFPNGWKPGDK